MNIILVTSGKGGVGKTTLSQALAFALTRKGRKVGLLDCDIRNPCIPTATAVSPNGLEPGDIIKPIDWHGVKIFSMGVLPILKDTPIMLTEDDMMSFIDQCFEAVDWSELDIIIVDMRPGATGEILKFNAKGIDGAVVITTPEKIAAQSVARMIRVLTERNIPIIGIVQNMGRFVYRRTTRSLGTGGMNLATEYNIPFLADIPFTWDIRRRTDEGVPVEGEEFDIIADKVLDFIEEKKKSAVHS